MNKTGGGGCRLPCRSPLRCVEIRKFGRFRILFSVYYWYNKMEGIW